MARSSYSESDYFELTLGQADAQWGAILARTTPAPGTRQARFTPVEAILCAAARLVVVDYDKLNSSNVRDAAPPIRVLGGLFERPAKSIVDKMSNLDGKRGRSKGGKHELAVGVRLGSDLKLLATLYRVVFASARDHGVGPARLPDFLGVELGGTPELLGLEELHDQDVDEYLEGQIDELSVPSADLTATEHHLMTQIRLGQNRFALGVYRNCAHSCVFCGFSLEDKVRPSLLRAGHIKPWRASSDDERLDVTNGIAACPTHDAAFDAGLITLRGDLTVRRSARLDRAISRNQSVAQAFTADSLRPDLHFPDSAQMPRAEYLDYHQTYVFG
ncbi:hypothetical protein GCM10027059_24460 [Myceligenerans halotolerans]